MNFNRNLTARNDANPATNTFVTSPEERSYRDHTWAFSEYL